jgi:hypothetical protein
MVNMWTIAGGAILWAVATVSAVTAATLPEPLVKQIRGNPDGFARQATGAILGHGGARGLTAEGVARLVAVEQARLRAREAARLLSADLDGDGRVTADELAALAGLDELSARAALELMFRAADADGDGAAAMPEVYAMAEARAAQAVTRTRSRAETILACDRDGDGAVRIDEVLETIAAVQAGG